MILGVRGALTAGRSVLCDRPLSPLHGGNARVPSSTTSRRHPLSSLGEHLDQFATDHETISNFVRSKLGALGLPCQFGGALRDATVITGPGPSRAEVR